ncbi:hypothetical protein [Alicyclobacillus dauci]|uniref:DUF4830 domain-containing protein n=1 Tax=Alicyclobacillus dauci TaxID=1475485 RepID=A0ABY6Z7X0_9BACL|nr:hypothetical protein [Alicyclobacillus dauci]WAH38927.1 hypothetical protein NZD86_10825 [Alicyclobacillus dauci]
MNSETMQLRRRRKRTNHFIVLVVAFLVLFFGSWLLLRPVMTDNNSPQATTRRFIGFIELKEFDQAHSLMTPAFQNVPGWHGMLYSLYTSIDPAEAGYHVVSVKDGIAQVQFSNESGGYLYLKQVNGKWLVASPNELPGAGPAPQGTVPPAGAGSGSSGSGTNGQ